MPRKGHISKHICRHSRRQAGQPQQFPLKSLLIPRHTRHGCVCSDHCLWDLGTNFEKYLKTFTKLAQTTAVRTVRSCTLSLRFMSLTQITPYNNQEPSWFPELWLISCMKSKSVFITCKIGYRVLYVHIILHENILLMSDTWSNLFWKRDTILKPFI